VSVGVSFFFIPFIFVSLSSFFVSVVVVVVVVMPVCRPLFLLPHIPHMIWYIFWGGKGVVWMSPSEPQSIEACIRMEDLCHTARYPFQDGRQQYSCCSKLCKWARFNSRPRRLSPCQAFFVIAVNVVQLALAVAVRANDRSRNVLSGRVGGDTGSCRGCGKR
jgi:hypothetical protein